MVVKVQRLRGGQVKLRVSRKNGAQEDVGIVSCGSSPAEIKKALLDLLAQMPETAVRERTFTTVAQDVTGGGE
jgi:hypothetical protein